MLDILSFYENNSFKRVKKLNNSDIDNQLKQFDDNIICWNNELYLPVTEDENIYDLVKLRHLYSAVDFSVLDTDAIIVINDNYALLAGLLPQNVPVCMTDISIADDQIESIRELNGINKLHLQSLDDITNATKKTVILLDDNITKLYDMLNVKYGIFLSRESNVVVYSFFDYILSMYSVLGKQTNEVFRMKEIITDDDWCIIKAEAGNINSV